MNDDQIVRMYWDRDEKAISVTSEKYGSYCLHIAGNILGNHEDAEECVNDTYLNTWNSIPTNRPEMLSTYLGKIVRNLSFNLYKKNRAEKRGAGQIGLVLDELAELIADSNRPEDELDCKLLSESVNRFLETLPAEKRKLFVCRYWYADSVKDIAKRFEMTENNVSVALSRLRTGLHNYLLERGFEL
ncbi:MAG: sigma-70 family RNA polymerase sigma factor [Lachnospiraceae bacterium]|nr:sigma-70 family RNA polymerase sigma factor [Lachnospiraceae bacterium]